MDRSKKQITTQNLSFVQAFNLSPYLTQFSLITLVKDVNVERQIKREEGWKETAEEH